MKKMHGFLAAAIVLSFVGSTRAHATAGTKPEAFAKLQSMVGHWESQSVKNEKSTLDIELTGGGSAILERSRDTIDGKPRGDDHGLLPGWRQSADDALLHGGESANDARYVCAGEQDVDVRFYQRHEFEECG